MALSSFLVSSRHLLDSSTIIELTDLVYLISVIRFNCICFLCNTLCVFLQAMFPAYKTTHEAMNTYMTGIVNIPANVVAYIVHTVFEHIYTVPNYKLSVGIVDNTCKKYCARPSPLGSSANDMLGAIIPLDMYELYAPVTPFMCPGVLIHNLVIPTGTTGQQDCQIGIDRRTDQEESVMLISQKNFIKACIICTTPESYFMGL